MLNFKYNRRLHILTLIGLLFITTITTVVFVVSPLDEEFYGGIGLLLVLLVWMVFWWMRGREGLLKCFPYFHYITLFLELLVHFFALIYALINSIRLVFALLKEPFSIWEPVNVALQLLVVLVYLLLVYLLAAVPYVIFKANEIENEELNREIRTDALVPMAAPVAQV